MRHVFFRLGQLRAAAVVGVIVAFAINAPGAFAASATTGGSGNASCSNNALTGQGSCSFSGTGSGQFSGDFTQPIPTADQQLCGTATSDPSDTFCGHFVLNFNNVQGTVTVNINFDIANDFDLCLADATTGVVITDAQGNPICSTQTDTNFETITFTVTCSTTSLEVQVIPFSFAFPGPTPLTPATFTGTASGSLTSCNGNTGGTNGGGTKAASGHKVTGGGQLTVVTSSDTNFSVNAIQISSTGNAGPAKGKFRVSTRTCDFRGIVDTAEWNDATQTATIHGHSSSNSSVLFNATIHDGGEGNSNPNDAVSSDKCNANGNVARGNTQYHKPA